MIALLEGGGRELRPTLTLEPCTNAWTLVVGLRCRRSSVSRSRRWLRVLSATCQHYGQTPPVDPADHDTEGVALAVRRRVTTQRLRVALRALSVPVPVTLSSLIGLLSFYRYPSRELKYVLCAVVTESCHPHNTGGTGFLRGIVLERLPNLELN